MASYFPTPNFLIPDNPGFAQLLSQNFLGMKLDSENIKNGAISSGQLATLVPDSDPRIVYSANWTIATASSIAPAGFVGGYKSKYHTTNTTNEFLQYSDVVKGFYVYCITGPDCGQVNVSVDGGSNTLIDLYSASYGISLVFSQALVNNQHTIKMVLAGTKNSSSNGYRFNFVGISEGQLITDLNILPNGLNDISVNSVSGNKVQSNTTLFNVALSNGAGTFSVDANGNMTATSATISGTINGSTIVGGSINIGSGYFKVLSNGEVIFSPPASQNDAVFLQNASLLVFQDQFNSIICDMYAYGANMTINANNQNIYIYGAGFTVDWQPSLFAIGTNLQVNGNTTATGTKSAIEPTSEGDVLLYSVESPEVLYQDFGTAQTLKGECEVTFDKLFLEVTHTSEEYKVFLTARGRYSYLYWKKESDTSFKIFCDSDIEVDWMAVANRRGYKDPEHRFKHTQRYVSNPPKQDYRKKRKTKST